MTQFSFYTATEVYQERYYQLPRVFFKNEKYINLSNDAKIAYTLLKDRFQYSIKNNWIDDQGHIYFIFTVKELMELLNCREGKITKIKKELESCNLLYQRRVPPKIINGIKTGQPNFLYLGKPQVNSDDVYRDTNDSSQIAKIAIQEKHDNTTDSSQIAKIAIQEKHDNTTGSSQIAKIANNVFNNNTLDTNRYLKDTDKDQAQEKLLLENFAEIMKDDSIATFIPERVLKLIATFSSSYLEAQQTVKTIHNAKHKAEQLTDVSVVFENLNPYGINAEAALYNTLLKAYQKQKTEQVDNIQNLIFVYVKNWFVEKPCAAIKLDSEHSELPKVTLFDWSQTDA